MVKNYSSIGTANIKLYNLSTILCALLSEKHASRAWLASHLGLSTATVTNLISELLEQGIVVEDGTLSNRNKNNVGRPQTLIRLVPQSRFALAIYIEVGSIKVALTDIYGKSFDNDVVEHPLNLSAEQVLEQVSHVAKTLIQRSGIGHEQIVGIGIGASGLVDSTSGENIVAHNLGWSNLHLREYFSNTLNLPVMVDNNVRAMALGESMFGVGLTVEILAFIYGRIGVGAGFVIGNQLYRGMSSGAGEIGHTTVVMEGGELCSCGNTGCLQTIVSETKLIQAANAIADFNSIPEIYDAARAGNHSIKLLMERHATYLGIAIANLINILNPNMIVLGGMFADAYDLWLPPIEKIVHQRTFADLGRVVALKPTAFGDNAGIVGAASLALDAFFYRQLNPFPTVM